MTTISIREARVRLGELVDQLQPGEKPLRLGNVPKKIEALLQKQEGFFLKRGGDQNACLNDNFYGNYILESTQCPLHPF